MKIPRSMQPLVDDGVIDEVLRPLKSGKEASVYVVRSGSEVLCAKVYKDMGQRSFQARAQYQEGRKVRGSRQGRAMARASKFGRRQQEDAWKNTEVETLYRLADSGIRVPQPHDYANGVLLMELVTDDTGNSAPRLSDVELTPDQARDFHASLIRDVLHMLCIGLIHGDLSEYNVLVSADGPVIIDFPQVVDAAGNNAARAMLLRDVHNLRDSFSRFAPELGTTFYGEEMWAFYEQGTLQPDTALTGTFAFDDGVVDLEAVEIAIEEARREAVIREEGRKAADEGDQ